MYTYFKVSFVCRYLVDTTDFKTEHNICYYLLHYTPPITYYQIILCNYLFLIIYKTTQQKKL